MNNFDMMRKATLLADSESAYQLAKRVVELEQEIERLDSELQEKALTDDGVLADAYWHCVDLIEPHCDGNGCVSSTSLIRSVTGSLEFLIEQWKEKRELEYRLESLDK